MPTPIVVKNLKTLIVTPEHEKVFVGGSALWCRVFNEPVRVWLQSLDKSIKIISGEDISKGQFRWPLGMPLVRSLGLGIHELRSHVPNGIIWILFMVYQKDAEASYAKF